MLDPHLIPYSKLPSALKTIDQRVASMYEQLKTYTLGFTGHLDILVSNITVLHHDLNKKVEELNQKIKTMSGLKPISTDIGKKFTHGTYKKLTIDSAFSATSSSLKECLNGQIDTLCKEYHRQITEISSKVQAELNFLKDSDTENKAQYSQYEQAAKQYKDAKAKQKRVPHAKEAYEKAHQAALACHEQFQVKAQKSSLTFEQLLTRFESLEEWRAKAMHDILDSFASSLFNAATEFVSSKSELYREIQSLDSHCENQRITNFDFLLSVDADDRYQAFAFPHQITSVLPTSVLFPNATQQGRKFYHVKNDFTGYGDYLTVIQGEVVAGVENQGDLMWCINVNDSIGLVELNNLTEVT